MKPARRFALPLLACLALGAPAAAQQQSESYKFLQAVKDSKGDDVTRMIDTPGSRIINTHDYGTGEGALHITVKRGDTLYTRFLLQKGADPNIRDDKGTTPLMIAATTGQQAMVELLTAAHADPNIANSSGETPLIRAVQLRDTTMIRTLLAAGANPDQTDSIAGMSARDYADRDTRTPELAKLLDAAPKKAKSSKVAGPGL